MSSTKKRTTLDSSLVKKIARADRPDYSILVVLGAVMALAILSGCASAPVGGSSDPYQYNTATGSPAVGIYPWH